MDVPFFLIMMVALFVAAMAMIIPGVSGSFVMLTLGVYTTVIGAVKDLDFAIIIPYNIDRFKEKRWQHGRRIRFRFYYDRR